MSKLQEFRMQKGLSQFELALLSNVSINSIQRFEQKKYCIDNSHLETLVSLADCLNISFLDLVEDEELSRRLSKQAIRAQLVQNAER